MGQKGVVFTTSLTIQQCGHLFRETGDKVNGLKGKLMGGMASVMGNGEATGFYTPSFDSPFAGIDGAPDFAVGVNIMKFNGGGQGNGTHVHMYVDDQGDQRSVQLVSKHGLTGGMRSTRMTQKFFEQFRAADPRLRVTEGNIQ